LLVEVGTHGDSSHHNRVPNSKKKESPKTLIVDFEHFWVILKKSCWSEWGLVLTRVAKIEYPTQKQKSLLKL